MSVRVYEPPVDPSSIPIETVAGTNDARRQVMHVGSGMSTEDRAGERGRSGFVFSASSGRHNAGAIGTTTVRLTLQNPTGSGRVLHVYRTDLFSSLVVGYFGFLINPTTDLPTTAKTVVNHYIGHPNTSSALAKADTGVAMTGGSDSGIVIPVPSGDSNKLLFNAPYVVSPGLMLGLQATFSAETSAIVTATWWEEAV